MWRVQFARPTKVYSMKSSFSSVYKLPALICRMLLLAVLWMPWAYAADVEPNVIRWSTASEFDNFGYEVYRGLSETGPFEKINPEIIPGAGTTDLPQSYEFVDSAIETETVYWYYIESVSMSGERKRISPIYSAEPKPQARQ